MNVASCPSRDELMAFARGELADGDIEQIGEHLDRCTECDTTVALFDEQSDTFVDKFRVASAEGAVIEDAEFDRAVARINAIGRDPVQTLDSATQEHSAALPGHLRDYRLLARLGEGGMGMVYKALHTKLQRVVALKVLPVHHRRNPASIARFQREIEAVGKLDHPNVVRAFDAGEDDDMHYLVMELVDGIDLHTLVKQRGPLPVADACEIIRQAALGLQHAHEHGLVHRDLKPSNLMIAVSGQETAVRSQEPGVRGRESDVSDSSSALRTPHSAFVKILDLGLALLQGEHLLSEHLTATGQVMGTLDYMAPEQADDSHGVDIRADIYALGCTFYKLLTGHAPFSGDSHNTIAKKLRGHAEDAPSSVREIRPEVPEALADLIGRMLAKSPDDRPATPAEVAALLAPFAAKHDLAALAAQVELPAEDGVLAASASEIPVLIGGDGGVPGRSMPDDGRSPRHRRGGLWIWTGLLLMAVSTVCQVITIAAMTHAASNAALSPAGVAHFINQSLGPALLAGPAFVVGLVFVIVGLVRLLLGTATVAKAPSAAHSRWRLWHGVAVGLIVLLMVGFTVVTVITPHGQLMIETSDSDVQVVVSTVEENTRIAVVDTRTSKTIKLLPGKYGVRIVGEEADYELDKDVLTILRGKRVLVKVRRKPIPPHDQHGGLTPKVFAKGEPVNGLVTALSVHPTTWNVGDEVELTCTYENVSGEAIHVPVWGVLFPALEFTSISPNATGFGLGGKPGDKPLGPEAFLKLPAGETKTFQIRGRYNDIQRLTMEGPQGHVMWYRMPAGCRFQVRALLDTSDEQHEGFLREQERQRGIPGLWEGKVTSGTVEIRTTDDQFAVPRHERLVPAQRAAGRTEAGLAVSLWCSSVEWRPGDEIVLGCVYHNMTDESMFVPVWGVLSPAMELSGPVGASRATDGDRELIYRDVFAEVPAGESKTFYRRAGLDENGRLSITWPTGAVQTWDLQNGQVRLQAQLNTSGHENLLKRYAADAVRIKRFWQGKVVSGPLQVTVSGLSLPAADEPVVEPTYSGKPLSYWVEKLQDRDPEYRKKAVTAVVSFGRPGAAPLVGMLRNGDTETKRLALNGLRQLAPEADDVLPAAIAALDDPDKVVRAHAATCVGRFGPRAAEAVPKLLSMLKNEGEYASDIVAWTLWHVRSEPEKTVPALIEAARNDPLARGAAAYALGDFPEQAKQSIPALRELVGKGTSPNLLFQPLSIDYNPFYEFYLTHPPDREGLDSLTHVVLFSLAKLGPEGISEVLSLASHEDPQVRAAVAERLPLIGTPAAISALVEMSDDEDRQVKSHATIKVFQLAGKNAPVLLAGMRDRPQTVRMSVARAIGEHCWSSRTHIYGNVPPAEDVLSDLAKTLKHFRDTKTNQTHHFLTNDEVRISALVALGLLGTDEAKALLVETLEKDKTPAVRQTAIQVLRFLGENVPE